MADEKFTLAKAKIIAEKLEQRIDGLDGRVSKVESDIDNVKHNNSCSDDQIDEIKLALYGSKTANFKGLVEYVKFVDDKISLMEQNLSKKIDEIDLSRTKTDTQKQFLIGIAKFFGYSGILAIMIKLLNFLGVK